MRWRNASPRKPHARQRACTSPARVTQMRSGGVVVAQLVSGALQGVRLCVTYDTTRTLSAAGKGINAATLRGLATAASAMAAS